MIGFISATDAAAAAKDVAGRLAAAANQRQQTEQTTATNASFDEAQAYAVQSQLLAMCGYSLAGFKMGMTSRAKMRQMGVTDPIFGFLAPSMVGQDGETMPRSWFGQPRVEAELAFILRKPIHGPITTAEAMDAVGSVCLAIEVLDSRYANFRFSLADVVADNTSAQRFVLGSELRDPRAVDVGNLGLSLEINGRVTAVASSAAVLGHPARSLAMLVEMLQRHYSDATRTAILRTGERRALLDAGTVILTGGITEAFGVDAGDFIRVRGDGLGEVTMTVGPRSDTPPPPLYAPPSARS
jgi:2-oxo-3-hexenedioate decarboxylase